MKYKNEFTEYYEDYIGQLIKEIESYPDERLMWERAGGIKNTSGNLCCHLIGNLNHFIGHGLANSGYKRDRIKEFNDQFIPAQKLIEELVLTQKMVVETLENIEDLDRPYSSELFGKPGSIRYFLTKLVTHLAYHVGQVNYHRRITTIA